MPFKNLFSYKYLHLLSRYFLSSTSKLATKCLLESRLFKGSEDTFFIEFSSWIIICFNWNWQPSNFWARGNRKNWHCSKTWSKWNFTNFSQSTFWNYLIIWRYFTLKKIEFISQKNTFKPVGWKELLDRLNASDLSNSMCNR